MPGLLGHALRKLLALSGANLHEVYGYEASTHADAGYGAQPGLCLGFILVLAWFLLLTNLSLQNENFSFALSYIGSM